MSKPIVLTHDQWDKIKNRLIDEYNLSIIISWKIKEKLGLTVREHISYSVPQGYKTDIRLDFYSEPKRTMFLLRYGEYINGELEATLASALDEITRQIDFEVISEILLKAGWTKIHFNPCGNYIDVNKWSNDNTSGVLGLGSQWLFRDKKILQCLF